MAPKMLATPRPRSSWVACRVQGLGLHVARQAPAASRQPRATKASRGGRQGAPTCRRYLFFCARARAMEMDSQTSIRQTTTARAICRPTSMRGSHQLWGATSRRRAQRGVRIVSSHFLPNEEASTVAWAGWPSAGECCQALGRALPPPHHGADAPARRAHHCGHNRHPAARGQGGRRRT